MVNSFDDIMKLLRPDTLAQLKQPQSLPVAYKVADAIGDDAASSRESPLPLPTSKPLERVEPHTPSATQNHPKTWSDLPLEITEDVFKCLARKELRACRLLDRKSSPTATRILFRTVCVSPSVFSVNRLYKISDQPSLAKLVRVIEVQTHYMVHWSFNCLIRTGPLAQRLLCLNPLDAAAEAIKLSDAYDIELSGQRRFQSEAPGTLSLALRSFHRLQHFVHVRPSSRSVTGDYLLDHDSDLFKRAGIGLLDQTNQYPLMNSVLQKCRHLRPVSLDLTSLYWWEFYNISQIPHLKELFSTVTDFKLTFQVESFDRPGCRLRKTNSYWANGLTKYVEQLCSHLPAVEKLWLGFDQLPSEDETVLPVCTFALSRMSALFFRLEDRWTLYPKLKTLTLEKMATNVKELCEFFLPHASTLKYLTITNMCIDGSRSRGANAGILCSMVRIIVFLHQYLNLDDVSFQGTFRDHKGVSLICSLGGKESLLKQVQEYICHRKPIPLTASSVKEAVRGPDGSDTTFTSNMIIMTRPSDGAKYEVTVDTDESWYLRPTNNTTDN